MARDPIDVDNDIVNPIAGELRHRARDAGAPAAVGRHVIRRVFTLERGLFAAPALPRHQASRARWRKRRC